RFRRRSPYTQDRGNRSAGRRTALADSARAPPAPAFPRTPVRQLLASCPDSPAFLSCRLNRLRFVGLDVVAGGRGERALALEQIVDGRAVQDLLGLLADPPPQFLLDFHAG